MLRIPPESGAAVMSIGVISVAGHLAGWTAFSAVLLVVAGALWVLFGTAFLTRLAFDTSGWVSDARRPVALTGVAATGVVGLALRLHGWSVGWVFLVLATLLWIMLMPLVLRNLRAPLVGGNFLVCVATQSLSILYGQCAIDTRSATALLAGATATVSGLTLYGTVLAGFDFRQLLSGAGDHWIAGGALAISTVAASKVSAALQVLGAAPVVTGVAWTADLVLCSMTFGWYVVLAVTELLKPRPRYDFRRWATVFPLGMTCAAGFGTATATGLHWPGEVARILMWPAVAVLCLTSWGAVRTLARTWTANAGSARGRAAYSRSAQPPDAGRPTSSPRR